MKKKEKLLNVSECLNPEFIERLKKVFPEEYKTSEESAKMFYDKSICEHEVLWKEFMGKLLGAVVFVENIPIEIKNNIVNEICDKYPHLERFRNIHIFLTK